MESIQDKFDYSLLKDEKVIFSNLCRQPWTNLYVPGGAILKKELESHVYSIPQLLVKGGITALILLDSEEVAETELFRIAIVADTQKIDNMMSHTRPRFSELVDFPADLEIDQFLRIENEVSVIRFNVEIENGKGGVLGEAAVDVGLLISNKNGRMFLYPNVAVPLDISITTDEAKITDLLSQAASIESLNPGNYSAKNCEESA